MSLHISILFHPTIKQTEQLADIALAVTIRDSGGLKADKIPLPVLASGRSQHDLAARVERSVAVYYACPALLPSCSTGVFKHFQLTLGGGPLGYLWVALDPQPHYWCQRRLVEICEMRWPQQSPLYLSGSSPSTACPTATPLPSIQLVHHLSVLATTLSQAAVASEVSQAENPLPSPSPQNQCTPHCKNCLLSDQSR